MDAHFRYVLFNQCSTPKIRDIKWTHIYLMSTLINALPPKTHDSKSTHICQMSALINALPRKLVTLNGRTFD